MTNLIFKLTPGLGYINKIKSNDFHTVPSDGIALQSSFEQNCCHKETEQYIQDRAVVRLCYKTRGQDSLKNVIELEKKKNYIKHSGPIGDVGKC